MMRCGRQMRWLEGVWLALRAGPAGEYSGRVRRWFLRMWWRFAPVKDIGKRRAFGSVRLGGAAVKAHPNLDFRWYPKPPHPGEGLLFRKEAKARVVLGLGRAGSSFAALAAPKPPVWAAFPFASPGGGRGMPFVHRAACSNRLWPYACAHRGRVPRGAMARGGQQMRRLGRCGSRFAPAGGRGWRTLCDGGFGGRGGAARRLRAAVEGALRGREA